MEWGIKLKNNLLKKMFVNFLFKLMLWFSIPLIVLLIIIVLDNLDFQWIYDLSPDFYFNIRNFFYEFKNVLPKLTMPIILFWVFGFLIILYRFLRKVFGFINSILKAANDLVNKDVLYIELPIELEDVQRQMNFLKRESEKNERLARENEQKKDELIVYLAHDIKTPLTSMIGYLSILDEISDMPKKQQRKYTKIALDKAYRLEELINELFDIARFNSEKIILEKEELNLNLMMEQIIDDFYPLLQDMHKEIIFNKDKEIKIIGDPDKLSRVFTNLIKNAINYSKDGSAVIVNILKKADKVVIEVINEGKKISQDKLAKIFEKFYRLDTARNSKTGGSGLGLAIAKEIVLLHEGNIYVKSDELMTTFTVELPL